MWTAEPVSRDQVVLRCERGKESLIFPVQLASKVGFATIPVDAESATSNDDQTNIHKSQTVAAVDNACRKGRSFLGLPLGRGISGDLQEAFIISLIYLYMFQTFLVNRI